MRWPSLATTKQSRSQQHQRRIHRTHTDDSTPQCHVSSEINIASYCQMIQFDDRRDLLESLLELLNLFEVVTELDDGRRAEQAILVNDKLPVL